MIDLRHKYHICHNSQNGLYKIHNIKCEKNFVGTIVSHLTHFELLLTNTFIVRNALLSSKLHGFECYPKPNAVQYWFCLNWGWLSAFRCTLKYRQYVTYCTHTPVGYGLSVVSYKIVDILILIYIRRYQFWFRVNYLALF